MQKQNIFAHGIKKRGEGLFFAFVCAVLILFFFRLQMTVKYKFPVLIMTIIIYFAFYILILRLQIRNKLGQIFEVPHLKLVLLYAFFLLLSSINAPNASKSLHLFAQGISVVPLYLLTVIVMRNMKDIRTFMNWILTVGTGMLIIARLGMFKQYYIQSGSKYASLSGAKIPRESFIYLDANIYAYMLIILMILLLHRILVEKNSLWQNAVYAGIFVTSCFSLIATYSRGAMTALILSILSMLIISKKIFSRRMLVFGILLMFAGVYVFFSTKIFRELQHRFKQDIVFVNGIPRVVNQSSLGHRITTAISTIRTFSKKPLLGWGDSGSVHEQWRQDDKSNWKWIRSSGNHVFYLNLLAIHGILAFACFMMLFAATFWHLHRDIRLLRTNGNLTVTLGYLLFAIMVILAIKGLLTAIGENFWIMSGVSMAFHEFARNSPEAIKM